MQAGSSGLLTLMVWTCGVSGNGEV